jgi:hypothetical protein
MHSHASRNRHCLNCGAALSGPYCLKCGQHDVDYNRSFWHIVEDGLEGVLHFDGKFFKSVRYLVARPGFLTREFIAGRRASYTHPLRFYIFASFLFFATQALVGQKDKPVGAVDPKTGAEAAVKDDDMQKADAERHPLAEKAADAAPPAPAAGADTVSSGTSKSPWFRRMLGGKLGPLQRGALIREMAHLMPTMLFLCMPILAAVLKLVYLRSARLYIEHLIFALHVMAFVFLAMLVGDLLQALARHFGDGTESFVGLLVFCLSSWVVFRCFRVVYGQGKLKTLLKMGLVGGAYGAILIVGVCAVVVASYYIVANET